MSGLELAVITINIDPTIELGPVTLAWHGVMIVVGIAVGTGIAARYVRELGLERAAVLNAVLVIAVAGIVGARFLYLALNEPAALIRPADWIAARGFAFYGAVVLGGLAVAVYLWRSHLSVRYLDALAAGFPLGLAVGRIGDVINGEHYGPATDLPWALRHTHPDADVPSAALAYHDGGLYELALGLLLFAVIWPLRHRFRRPLTLFWTVVALYGLGRFVMFFYRSDTDPGALGLNVAQWTSLALAAAALVGLAVARFGGRAGTHRVPGRVVGP
jgi:phosphatidylglycerol---prolipoprotein diacylglyceryl transferase